MTSDPSAPASAWPRYAIAAAGFGLLLLVWISKTWQFQPHRPTRDVPQVRPLRVVPFAPEPSAAPGVWVVVVSLSDRSPIAGARIRYALNTADPSKPPPETLTDAQGRALLEALGDGVMDVAAAGYLGVRGQVRFRPGQYTVALTPTGSVELTFVTETEAPVSGVEVELEPSIPSRPTVQVGDLQEMPELAWKPETWKVRSGYNGIVFWSDLPPGVSYRWRVTSPHLVQLDPLPAVKSGISPSPTGGFVIEQDSSDPGRNTSGEFSVNSGEMVRLKARVLVSSSVSGAIPRSGTPVSGQKGDVGLFHRTVHVAPSGATVNAYDVEMNGPPDPAGSFRFLAAKPGQKRVAAVWQHPEAHYHFASVNFDLLPGEDKNLGTLSAATGHTVEGIVRLEGVEFLPLEVRNSDLRAIVSINNYPPRPHPPGVMISHLLEVPIGKPFYLHGLMKGDLIADAQMGLEIPAVEGITWERQPEVRIVLPEKNRLELALRAKVLVPCRVRVTFPAGGRPDRMKLQLLPMNGGKGIPGAGLRPPDDPAAREAVETFMVPPGTYTAWCFTDGLNSKNPMNYFGENKVIVAAGQRNEVVIEVGTAAVVKGRALDALGQPLQTALHFKIPSVSDDIVYRCETDRLGNFVLTGVAPGQVLQPVLFEGHIRTGLPGSEVFAELRRSR